MAIIGMPICYIIIKGKGFSFLSFTSHDFLEDLGIMLVLGLIGGYFFGLNFWLQMEKKYKKEKGIKK
ncbi:MAG: hypothetical protein WC614_02360 [bacterium]